MENPSVIHSRYIPTAAIATLIQMVKDAFFLKRSPRIGTIIMYKAVMKPAFPTVVCMMPNCCKVLATPSAVPQHTPPITSFHLLPFFGKTCVLASPCFGRFNIKIQGISTMPPTRQRTALKVNGPTYSIPALWATKATPQINAVNNSIKLLSTLFLFISLSSYVKFPDNIEKSRIE